jgi:hypothetical protein
MVRSLCIVGISCATIGVFSACSASRPPSTTATNHDTGPPAQVVRTEPPEYHHIPQGAWSNAAEPSTSQSNAATTADNAFDSAMQLEPMVVPGTPVNQTVEEESETTEESEDQ